MTTAYSGDGITFPDNSVQATAPRVGMVNRIINGDMRIDQRNAGASVSVSGDLYILDRWRGDNNGGGGVFSGQQSTTAPSNFVNSLLLTVTTPDASIGATEAYTFTQRVEGFNIADFGWGTASAQTVTLSFMVRSSVTGAFGGSLQNADNTRSYPFSYTISSANTWETKSVTIAGETSGTWQTSTGIGIRCAFSLGVGASRKSTAGVWASADYRAPTGSVDLISTSGATFYITGVQLEKGSTATDFEYVDYGRQLIQCQRYLPAFVEAAINANLPFVGCGVNGTNQTGTYTFEVATRVPPTGITVSAASHFSSLRPSSGSTVATAISFAAASRYACQLQVSAASGLTADVPYLLFANSASATMLFTGCEL